MRTDHDLSIRSVTDWGEVEVSCPVCGRVKFQTVAYLRDYLSGWVTV